MEGVSLNVEFDGWMSFQTFTKRFFDMLYG